jgi:NAD-dependent dihydropyrimidine dehydrogenase PreA subunit
MVVLSWLFPRAAHWTLDRSGIRGRFGETLIKGEEEDDDEEDEEVAEQENESGDKQRVGPRNLPNRTIYHLDLRSRNQAAPFVEEIKRIASEATVQTVSLGSWTVKPPSGDSNGTTSNGTGPLVINLLGGAPSKGNGNGTSSTAAQEISSAAENPLITPGGPIRIEETPARRWYPVIDYSRCTNCMECIDFCLFGVYGVDGQETILVEQPDNCRKGCPACSRVCPENAIIFPQHKTPAIAGSPVENAGGLKIDLSQLFGAPSAIEIAAQERDGELVAVGRDAVGLTVGIPKRQDGKQAEPKDDLDSLMDQLDSLEL